MKHLRPMAIAGLLSLAACSSGTVKDTLGISRAAPDEYRVVSRPPLSVPPQFDLRPPSATAQTPNQLPTSKQAETLVLGPDTPTGKPVLQPGTADTAVQPVIVTNSRPGTGAEAQFLKNAGAGTADPTVRDKLAEDKYAAQNQQPDDSSWWDIFSTNPPKKEPVVDSQKEADRIKQNADSGQPVTTGDTPEAQTRDTGVLGRIFGY